MAEPQQLDESRYERIQPPAPPHGLPPLGDRFEPGRNPVLRCPLPPVSATPDTMRQFYQAGIPQNRTFVPPSVPATQATETTNISSTQVSSSTAPASKVSGFQVQSVAVSSPVLSQGESFQSTLSVSKSFLLLHVAVSVPARIRLYSTAAAQAADAARAAVEPVSPGLETGLIADLLLELPSELNWTCSPLIGGFNDDSPRSPVVYVTVTNPQVSSTGITATFIYLPLES